MPKAPSPRLAAPRSRAIRAVAALLVLSATTPALAQQGRTVTAVSVRGNARTTAADLLASVSTRAGAPFDRDTIRRDIRALWDLGFFEDIRVESAPSERGLGIVFVVREKPAVRHVRFDGNDDVETDKIREVVDVNDNDLLNVAELRRNVEKIRELYADKGYFLAEVSYAILPVAGREREVDVVFRIVEHAQVEVQRVTFVGNENVSADDIKAVMETSEGSPMGVLSSAGTFRQEVFEQDLQKIEALYYDRGHLNVRVANPRVALSPDRRSIFITIEIEEGPRYRIGRLAFVEHDDLDREREPLGGRRLVRSMIRSAPGDWFSRTAVMQDVLRIMTHYQDAGYANVNIEPQYQQDVGRRRIDLTLTIERGPVVTVERINIRGNSKTRDSVIRRELTIGEGQRYSRSQIELSRRRVTQLGYFERADFSTSRGSADNRIVVNVEVAEKATGTFQIGAGFSSLESVIFTAQVQQQNLFGRGQALTLQAQLSGLRQIIQLSLIEPYTLGTRWVSQVDLYNQVRYFPQFQRSSLGGSLTLGYPITPEVRFFGTYTIEQVGVSTGSASFLGNTGAQVNTQPRLPIDNLYSAGLTSSLRGSVNYDTRDNRLFPTSGGFHGLSVEWADPAIGSARAFQRWQAFGRLYFPVGWGFVLKLNAQGGLITSRQLEGVPIYERYFLGGIFDVRGFGLRQLGPRVAVCSSLYADCVADTRGVPIGGNLQVFFNLELEFPILEKVGIRGVLFADAGNAFNLERRFCDAPADSNASELWQFSDPCSLIGSGGRWENLLRLRTSWGFGFRWFSPLGPLRFEWGFPFRPLPGENPSQFEFTIGNFF